VICWTVFPLMTICRLMSAIYISRHCKLPMASSPRYHARNLAGRYGLARSTETTSHRSRPAKRSCRRNARGVHPWQLKDLQAHDQAARRVCGPVCNTCLSCWLRRSGAVIFGMCIMLCQGHFILLREFLYSSTQQVHRQFVSSYACKI
jgi:hypothetical protein